MFEKFPNGSAGFLPVSIPNRMSRFGARFLALVVIFSFAATCDVWAAPASTVATLSITSAGSSVATVPAKTAVTLTASVRAAAVSSPGGSISPGQVKFCDAAAIYCTDSHLLGLAQLTSAGTATWKFIPGQGVHSYKAVFVGTNTFASSASSPEPLTVTATSGTMATSTALSYSGSQGAYSLSATVPAGSSVSPTGTVSFVDTSNANYVLAASSLAATGANAISFLNSYNYLTAATPTSSESDSYLAVGDFNGDGIPDIAVTTSGSSQLSILLGNGDGTFRSSVITFPGTGEAPYYIVAADFNNDGKLDLALAAETGLKILLGNGDGTFQPPQTITNAIAVIAASDVNGDGNIDIVQVAGGAVTVLLGNGDGTFTPASRTSPVSGGTSLVVADFNGDGKPDIAVTDYMDTHTYLGIDVLLGNGDGTFGPQTVIAKNAAVYGLVAADLSGNGKIDLVATNNSNLPLTILMGNGDGTFTQLPPDPATAFLADAVAVADFNGDGILDLAVPDSISGNVYVLLGKGDGTFTVDTYSPSILNFVSDSIVTGDFNGDGQADMAAGFDDNNSPNINDDQVKVWLGQAATTAIATATNISPVGTGTHYVDAVYVGDSVYTGSTSNLVPLLAQQVPTALTLTAAPSANSSAGQSVTLTATLNPSLAQDHSASGAVKFTSGSTNLGSANVGNGIATLPTTALPTGADSLKAVYAGDTNFTSSTSAILPYTVYVAQAQTITFPQPAAPAYAGTSVTLTATDSSGLPVTYTVVSGPATVSYTTLTYTGVGTVVVEANQAGDAAYLAATPVQRTITVMLLTEPLTTTSPAITTVVTFTASGTLAAPIGVYTQGAANLDFNFVSGGTCAPGTTYTIGQTCTVAFTFTPTHPGLRYGGISLADSTGSLLANSYIYGIGNGPQLVYSPATQTLLGSGFSFASGVAADGNGNLFVSDNLTNVDGLSEIFANGSSRTIGTFPAAQDVAVDGSGNVFLANHRNTVSEVLAVNGTIPTTPTIRTISTSFAALNGMKVDANGNVFLASGSSAGTDDAVYEILAVNGVIPASPTILTLGGNSSGFASPTGIAIDLSGNIFVSDENNNAVYEMPAVNGVIPASPTIRTLGSSFSEPTNVALDIAGNLFVADYGNHAVKEILAVNGSIPATNPTILTLGSGFVMPQGLYVDGSGNVFVADSGHSQAIRLDYSSASTLNFATTTVGSTSTDSPQTVTLTNDGNTSLTFSVPASGLNPSITAGFTLSSSSTCSQLSPASTIATLAADTSCSDVISFTPVAAGSDNGKLVLTDDNLNIPSSTQTILLNGNGLASPSIVFTVPDHIYGDAPFAVAATSNSPGTFTYSVVSGPATISGSTVTLTGAGVVTLRASQAAAGTFAAGTQDASFTVFKEPQTISFAAPASPVTYGTGTITLSASASSGLPVTFSILSGPGALSGNVLTTTGIGAIVVAANQPGNANYAAAPQVTHTIIVNGAIPTVVLTASPNPVFLHNPVLLTAAVSSISITPPGSVTFYDGSTPLGTSLLSGGIATLTVSNLALGTHPITADYSGGIGFLPTASPSVSEIVEDFSLTMLSGDQIIPHGGTAVYKFTVSPIGGATMPAAISFKVSGEPDTSTITFAPATASAGSGDTTVTLTIQTPNYPVGPWSESMTKPAALLALLAAGGLLLPFRRQRILKFLLITMVTFITLTGCGSGWKTQHFVVAVTASSGVLSHTQSATLTSQ